LKVRLGKEKASEFNTEFAEGTEKRRSDLRKALTI